ncbi:DNA methyltransferase [Sphingomonas sp. Leaf67]|uniref:type ISP restriction/modification enzyme n=1 Tax=Sphingomonas sp. Leaf67 TaxID=1736230 RepID=UPI0006FBBB59|nr:type ISP restriction/modification enzyme [Sphingomonas sp. Leaf67]KQN90790.1 DNA methyltransferase [Sphingomonas sp. Leaf67]
MSRQLINEYRADLDRLRTVSGSRRESVLREAFKDLLKRWGRTHDLLFVPEHTITTPQKNRIYLDGALLHALRVPFGYWEAKDADDNLDAEIAAKTRKGYPRDNIIYSDDHTAILIQDGHEVARVAMDDTEALHLLLVRFFAHERQEIADFNTAVRQFSHDLPAVLGALRDRIAKKRKASKLFVAAEKAFLAHAQEAINPVVTQDDVQEMLIQHILTEDIFAKVFDNPDFHRQNNVASELYKLEDKLFARGEKSTLLRALSPYYSGIARTAAVIQSHSEKQGFLKGLYENFYKVYNAKAADRLGVVYTPGEIVRFMIRSTDWLCEKHFGKNLVDRGVEILDPATGTGTFIVELLEHFRGHHEKLRHKYKEELHANEVAILPYYVANLNIEATYQAITGQFAEFENLCFVDTLDNVDALGIHAGHQFDLLGSLTDENIERIKKQNRRKISVIIGNPPYNANQQNENDNNKNRAYAHIDKRIKDTYIKASTAQKTKLYDMYARFYRWASDRLGDEGVLAFVTNRSFIDSRTFDGFRRLVAKDFQEIWLVDLGGDIRTNPNLSGTKHNIFGIQTGVAIALFVRKPRLAGCKIRYIRRPEDETADDKRSWLSSAELRNLPLTTLRPNVDGRWLQTEEAVGWSAMLPLATDKAKHAKTSRDQQAIFKLFSAGLKTNRDEWVFDRSEEILHQKISYFISVLNDKTAKSVLDLADRIKISSSLRLPRTAKRVERSRIVTVASRPFDRKLYYSDSDLSDRMTKNHVEMWGLNIDELNPTVAFRCVYSSDPLAALAVRGAFDYGLVKTGNGGTEGVARYRYTKSGERIDNITDWAFNKFVKEYGRKGVTKDAIFRYVYAVLHDPVYRETYALNLKREFPRIPFYPDFARWAAWGETLMALHIGYEEVAPWPVERIETPAKRAAGTTPKPILKSQPEAGVVVVDADTQIAGIPPEAWRYRLGNRSAIEWVLDQHKEKKPRDPTIAAKFNTYRFANYKESMIALLAKVVRVSVGTVAVTTAMKEIDRSTWA